MVQSEDAKDLIQNMIHYDPTSRFSIERIESHKWYYNQEYQIHQS